MGVIFDVQIRGQMGKCKSKNGRSMIDKVHVKVKHSKSYKKCTFFVILFF